ncbi:MAG: M20/M25/M40 family metallo-hydrolase, partial [Rhodospirillales bacterium]|nr:M20/M25/M40 family metallo-hydrolase [Rhodospirillales bacterium]
MDERGGDPGGSISLLLTCDEEGPAVDGTAQVLPWLADRGETLDACIVGEPTNPRFLGEMIKIGRRGSLNAVVTVHGVQGHAAYPELAENPIPPLLQMLQLMTDTPLDQGSAHFQPSILTITSIDVGNPVTNVIPAAARANVNIRFNDQHTAASLHHWLQRICREAS